MQNYEVEVKSLLGSPERAREVLDAIKKIDPSCTMMSKNKQLNHYFVAEPNMEFGSGTLKKLAQVVSRHISESAQSKLNDIAARAMDFSLRSREKDGTVILVVKASVGSDTSANGVARLEFEEIVDMNLQQLDSLILSAGFAYQAKWSREREEYVANGITVCMDKNAGYGYLAEFEKVVDSQDKADEARKEIDAFMAQVGALELPQDRLERMFAYYNTHWPEYYGTEKIFDIQ